MRAIALKRTNGKASRLAFTSISIHCVLVQPGLPPLTSEQSQLELKEIRRCNRGINPSAKKFHMKACWDDTKAGASLSLKMALVILSVVIGIASGGPETIVYSSASVMTVHNESAAKFLLTEAYAVDDFSADIWGRVESVRNQPLISAFPLFSFGDVYCYARRS